MLTAFKSLDLNALRLRNLMSGNCREGVIHRALPI